MIRSLRDIRLIDAVELLPRVPFEGTVWRVVREGRDPCQCSATGARWDDATFDVLYTATERDGAIAEMYFHLARGQPVFPSQVRYALHELEVSLTEALRLPELSDLAALGMDVSKYGQLAYHERVQEYPRSQEIAEVAHFLEYDALFVPNARWDCNNVVLFCDRLGPASLEAVREHGLIDWTNWARQNQR